MVDVTTVKGICQIGVVTFSNGIIVDKWQSHVNPEDYFDGMNGYIHGITEEKVKNAPNFKQVYSDTGLFRLEKTARKQDNSHSYIV